MCGLMTLAVLPRSKMREIAISVSFLYAAAVAGGAVGRSFGAAGVGGCTTTGLGARLGTVWTGLVGTTA